MRTRIALACIAPLVPLLAGAQDGVHYRCTNGGLVRRVEIAYETGAPVPCAVQYYKDTEAPGEAQILWRAQNETGFCEARARELVAQLRAWGWTCTEAAAAPLSDDTDALSAGGEASP